MSTFPRHNCSSHLVITGPCHFVTSSHQSSGITWHLRTNANISSFRLSFRAYGQVNFRRKHDNNVHETLWFPSWHSKFSDKMGSSWNNMLHVFLHRQRKCHGCFFNSNTIVKLQLHFVTWMHHMSYLNNSRLFWWQLTSLAAISELWPSADPSKWRRAATLRAQCWPQLLRSLSTGLAVSWVSGPGSSAPSSYDLQPTAAVQVLALS